MRNHPNDNFHSSVRTCSSFIPEKWKLSPLLLDEIALCPPPPTHCLGLTAAEGLTGRTGRAGCPMCPFVPLSFWPKELADPGTSCE